MSVNRERLIEVLVHITHLYEQGKGTESDGLTDPEPEFGSAAWAQGTWGSAVMSDPATHGLTLIPADVRGDMYVGRVKVDGSCGTAYCMAGWALQMSGVEQRWWQSADGTLKLKGSADGRSTSMFAQDWLGLEYEEAQELFDGNNSIGMIFAMCADYLDEDEEALRDEVYRRIPAIPQQQTP